MDAFFDDLILRASTFDELLGDGFETIAGQRADTERAAKRLAAWCRDAASGDWSVLERRLREDGWSIGHVLARFAAARRRPDAATPVWVEDAIWIDDALRGPFEDLATVVAADTPPCPFEHLFIPVIQQAEARLWSGIETRASSHLTAAARARLRHVLLAQLCTLAAPAIYERFTAFMPDELRTEAQSAERHGSTAQYTQFIAEMKAGGLRRLFECRPVLLRLIASLTRQWIETTREFVLRLDADLPAIRELCCSNADAQVVSIDTGLSDPHNSGHSVHIATFTDGRRVVYKPRDLRLDVTWHALIDRLNRAEPPVQLKAARAIARQGYGWVEYIDHHGCGDADDVQRFFRRAGALLALFHCFASGGMHQENLIACGDHPVPIDLEMILQAAERQQQPRYFWRDAVNVAVETYLNSVASVGLIPAWGRSHKNTLFLVGGLASSYKSTPGPGWQDTNSDAMRPWKSAGPKTLRPNLPHVNGQYAALGDHLDPFITGFEDYARFLVRRENASGPTLFDGFDRLPVRMGIRATRSYFLLINRLKDHRTLDDGVTWSAQADVIARQMDWDWDSDAVWPLQRAERAALLDLNVPHFMSLCDGSQIWDSAGVLIADTGKPSGLERAQTRFHRLSDAEIAWQRTVIQESTRVLVEGSGPAPAAGRQLLQPDWLEADDAERCVSEADSIAVDLCRRAIRQGATAAWIAHAGPGDTGIEQFSPLGPDLYNGVAGIGVFLAGHAGVTGSEWACQLALSAVATLRQDIGSRAAASLARAMGIGGATGWGSVVYALTVMSICLRDGELLADAQAAAELFTDDLIASDRRLDVIDGSAGAILCLLRLHRETHSRDVLQRAVRCGEHLLRQRRFGLEGRRSWCGQGIGRHMLTGMSHGAAGYAYSLTALSVASGHQEYAQAAAECLAFENGLYDAAQQNWPDLREKTETRWRCQWCHGAAGIGLARAAMGKRGALHPGLRTDIHHACAAVEASWPVASDSLCCGTLGSIELLREAAAVAGRQELGELASRRLMTLLATSVEGGGWRTGRSLGLFRGVAGVGYTLLREVDRSLPNVLIWD